ncbi:Na(+)/H(+) antiporter subunit B [Corticibacterium sp. UT-5YL-CI-8]|nr:Na(+)/H(+) antiporter subunit B [Tianweitania sp. UT-5YL-CI-8]
MKTLIFRTAAPFITALMLLFSVFVLLRGHNDPGGGFIGGLIAVAAFAVQGIAFGVPVVRRALYFHPMAIAGCGLLMAAFSGVLSYAFAVPYLSGLWAAPSLFGVTVDVSTVMTFDIGVYLVVVGAITSIALSLEDREDG